MKLKKLPSIFPLSHVLPTLGISNIMGEVINTGRLSTIKASGIGAGGRGAETLVLLRFAPRPTMISNAIHSPLQRGGGSRVSGAGEGLLWQITSL